MTKKAQIRYHSSYAIDAKVSEACVGVLYLAAQISARAAPYARHLGSRTHPSGASFSLDIQSVGIGCYFGVAPLHTYRDKITDAPAGSVAVSGIGNLAASWRDKPSSASSPFGNPQTTCHAESLNEMPR